MNWAEAGRRLWGERKDQSTSGLQAAERSALTQPDEIPTVPPAAPAAPEPSAETVSLLNGDPTQQLLTALGRFQRQVNVADSGAPAEAWVDNCMDQLITGIQIAHVRGWKGVKEALTDTARILQSYDDAGAASGSVAFMQDAYEILCLMVGDLIVDNVRSGVMDKWRERYTRAVSDLEKAGHALLDDEGNATAPARATQAVAAATATVAAAGPRPSNVTPFVPRTVAEEVALEEDGAAPLSESYADLDAPDVTYAEDEDAQAEEEDEYPDGTAYAYEAEPEAESPFDDEAVVQVEDEEALEEAKVVEAPRFDASMEDDPFDALEAEKRAYEAELAAERIELVEEVVVEASLEEEAEEDDAIADEPEAEAYEVIIEALVEEVAEENIEEAQEAEESLDETPMTVLPESEAMEEAYFDEEYLEEEACDEPAAEAVPEAPRPVETAEFLFDELMDGAPEGAEAIDLIAEDEEDSAVDLMSIEAEVAVAEPELAAAPEAEAAPAPAAEAEEVVEESPQVILRNAQAAMLRGDTRDAKLLALQLAANMARIEAQKAVQVVQDAVVRLTETEEAIVVAEGDVAHAEQRLAETMELRTTREHDLDVKRSGIAGLEKRAATVQASIAKLDEQIARLMAQRDAEQEKLTEAHAELEAERGEEQILLEDLDRIQESERAAGDTLDLARGRVEDLRAQRLEREQAWEACEQLLARQRESAENIERTLEAVQG